MSKRLIKCEGAVEFLRLCLNFGVTPTFAQVERRKARKWKKASDNYQREVLDEELRSKLSYLSHLKEEVRNAHKDIREECSFIRYIAIIQTMNTLRQNQYDEMMKSYVSCRRSLMWTNILTTCLRIVFLFSKTLSSAGDWNILYLKTSLQLKSKLTLREPIGKSNHLWKILMIRSWQVKNITFNRFELHSARKPFST